MEKGYSYNFRYADGLRLGLDKAEAAKRARLPILIDVIVAFRADRFWRRADLDFVRMPPGLLLAKIAVIVEQAAAGAGAAVTGDIID
jgi:hypothetical protein